MNIQSFFTKAGTVCSDGRLLRIAGIRDYRELVPDLGGYVINSSTCNALCLPVTFISCHWLETRRPWDKSHCLPAKAHLEKYIVVLYDFYDWTIKIYNKLIRGHFGFLLAEKKTKDFFISFHFFSHAVESWCHDSTILEGDLMWKFTLVSGDNCVGCKWPVLYKGTGSGPGGLVLLPLCVC